MNRTAFFSALLTKRGAILTLVIGSALLGAGFGFLPGLFAGSDDAEVSPAETTRQSGGTTETTTERTKDSTTTEQADSKTPPAPATTEFSGDSSDTDDQTAERTRTTEAEATTNPPASDPPTSPPTTSDPPTSPPATSNPPTSDPTTSDPNTDEPAEVGVKAESNSTASSLADYPSKSRRLNAVVNPPNTARTAGGA